MFKKNILLFLSTIILTACINDQADIEKKEEVVSIEDLSSQISVGAIDLTEGVHFKKINNPIKSKNNEIIVYFWYKCPHCYKFENTLKENYYKLADRNITIRNEHAALSSKWIPDAQLFYALRNLNLDKKSTPLLMEFFHNNKDKSITIESIYSKLNITENDIKQSISSEKTISMLKDSHEDAIQVGLRGTPSIIVEGKYLIINKGFKNYNEILDAVIKLSLIDDKKNAK